MEDRTTPTSWQDFRREMPVTEKWAYFDHAAVAPLSRPAAGAVESWLAQSLDDGDVHWPEWDQHKETVRKHAALMLGATPEEIAMVWSTTAGINIVAEGFPWEQGDNIVTLADEYPSNLYPWMHLAWRGVETRRVAVENRTPDIDAIARAIDDRTRMVTISWVGYANGYRHDLDALAELAHQRGALFFVDGIQAAGVFPLDLRETPVDFLAADGHKWMLGPEGAGLLFVRREHLGMLRPIGIGWNSVVHRHDFTRIELDIRDEAARYEGGSANMVGLQALGASIELLGRFGQDAIGQRLIEITDYACEKLQSVGAVISSPRIEGHKSGIVLFDLPGKELTEVRKRCLAEGIVLSFRAGLLRISPHAYNTEAEIDRLVDCLRTC